jgi:hypothetical protein
LISTHPINGDRKNFHVHFGEGLCVDVGTTEMSVDDLDAGSLAFTALFVDS